MKTKKGKGRVSWFNVQKGYGQIVADDGTIIFLFGEILGGDFYGLNIPKKNLVKHDDTVEFVAKKNDRPLFISSPELVWSATFCKKASNQS